MLISYNVECKEENPNNRKQVNYQMGKGNEMEMVDKIAESKNAVG